MPDGTDYTALLAATLASYNEALRLAGQPDVASQLQFEQDKTTAALTMVTELTGELGNANAALTSATNTIGTLVGKIQKATADLA